MHAPVRAANWEYLGGTPNDEKKLYIDTASIKRAGSFIRYWNRIVYENDIKRREYTVTLTEANCSTGQARILQLSVYYFDGTNKSDNRATQWAYPVPETFGEAEFNFVCSTSTAK